MSSQNVEEMSLSLGERLNYPYILATQIMTVQRNMERGLEQEVYEAIQGLRYLIPSDWEDDQFKKDLEKAEEKIIIDLRPRWCGIPVGLLKENSIEETRFKTWPLFHACINLLKRLNMLAKTMFTEISTGKGFTPIIEVPTTPKT